MSNNQHLYVGKDLGWRDIDTSPAEVDEYMTVSSDDHEWYRESSPFGRPILPATFLHFEAYKHNPGWFPEVTYGTLFARIAFDWCRPLFVGEPVRSHAWISEIQRKAERWHITCDVNVFNGADEIALHTRTTQTFLVDQEYRGIVRSKDEAPRQAKSRTSLLEGAEVLPLEPFKQFVTARMCDRFFGGTKNYHTDVEESKKMGFDDIVVGGPMSVCYIGAMLTRNFGQDLFTGARLGIKFVNILWPDREIAVTGVRAASTIDEFERQRVPFSLRIDDDHGRATVVAEGSCVLP